MGFGEEEFWDFLKPHARIEGFDFLRNKRVAVDLSYWAVQHEAAIEGCTRKPHIRLTFFRTVNLFSKFGAYPVFVLDGTLSPLKSQARVLQFFRSSGIDSSSLPEAEEEVVSDERNKAFRKCIEECVELLELLGMPVLKAQGEAEALCAELNREGYVDACITGDSDAFLYGAQCVIKRFHPNSKEPFECYHMSDIETGLGLKRNHLIAVSLLVGSDHNLNGITGIGLDEALQFVKVFDEDEVLNRLCDIAKGKEKNKDSAWRLSICQKIASRLNFPCDEIIQIYMRSHHGVDDVPIVEWSNPRTEMLVDYLTYQKQWDPSYIRQRLLPVLSTIYLRGMASGPTSDLLYGQYEFHSIQCVKVRYGHKVYVVNWKKAVPVSNEATHTVSEVLDLQQEPEEVLEMVEEIEVPCVRVEDGCCFLSSDEDMELVQKAFPERVSLFLKEEESKETISRIKKPSTASDGAPEKGETPGVQLSVTEFFRSSKAMAPENQLPESSLGPSQGKRKDQSSGVPKPVRRRLSFD